MTSTGARALVLCFLCFTGFLTFMAFAAVVCGGVWLGDFQRVNPPNSIRCPNFNYNDVLIKTLSTLDASDRTYCTYTPQTPQDDVCFSNTFSGGSYDARCYKASVVPPELIGFTAAVLGLGAVFFFFGAMTVAMVWYLFEKLRRLEAAPLPLPLSTPPSFPLHSFPSPTPQPEMVYPVIEPSSSFRQV